MPMRHRSHARSVAAANTTTDTTQTATATTTATVTAPPTPPPPPRRPRIPPGSLPQTATLPSADTAGFQKQMKGLWEGIRDDSARRALPAFFPEGAYAQLKAIGDPSADWQGRLVYDYELDIGAAHALLGAHAASAELVRVDVTQSYAHWVPSGVCENTVGYYEVPNARVVYSEDGQVSSFGIASMISWRGVWYVIHLGAILRPAIAGEVDDPQTGPGQAAYSGTC
jgi:hypothetical protein